jgi:hypothetical protein
MILNLGYHHVQICSGSGANLPWAKMDDYEDRRYIMGRVQMKDYITSGLILSGCSDDIIFVEGDLNDHFTPGKLLSADSQCECLYIAFSDGSLLNFCYDDDGIWRFTIQYQGLLLKEKITGSIETATNDVVIFHPGIKWCILGPVISKTN